MVEPVYTYRAQVVRWVDGDTVDLRVDCGFYTWVEARFRLYGINTPERGQVGYAEANAFVAAAAPVGSGIVVKTYKSADKYGRFLAQVWVGELCVNDALVAAGLAVVYMV